MKIVDIKNKYNEVLKQTAEIILAGGLVVFPSDTVYILAVDPTSEIGVKKLLEFKNRWTGKAISIAVLNKEMALEYVKLNENGQNIYSSLLPGPFTVVSDGKHKVVKGIEAENGTLGIRIPDNKYIHDLVELVGGPVTATSANLSGRTPNYSVQSFVRPLSNKKKEMIDLIVDGGKLPKNKPSTVIDATESEIKILRRGDLITGKSTSLISKSEKETEKIAEFLLRRNPPVDKSTSSLKEGRKSLGQSKPLVFLLSGDLGCGKTVFSRKIGHLLGVKEKITSPTYMIYNEYKIVESRKLKVESRKLKVESRKLKVESRKLKVESKIEKFLHMDLYKITSEKDLEEIKFLDLFSPSTSSGFTVACIEWPENMGENFLKKLKNIANVVSVNFEYVDERTREIRY